MTKDGAELITYDEFSSLLEQKSATGWTIADNDLLEAFAVFDTDGDMKVTRDEVCSTEKNTILACRNVLWEQVIIMTRNFKPPPVSKDGLMAACQARPMTLHIARHGMLSVYAMLESSCPYRCVKL